jgi:S-(hydroxymethyl)mycothiol dehydrogenase
MFTSDGQALGRVLGVGSFTTHTVVAAAQAIPIDDAIPADVACLIGCGVATGVGAVLFAAKPDPGSRVCVFGCGAVGASVILGARLAHASRIVAVDVSPNKLEWARELGATDVVDAREGDPAKRIREMCGGGVDYAFEAIGLPQTLAQAASCLDMGGTCVLIGVPAPQTSFSLSMVKFFYGRQTLKTTFCGDCLPARDFPLLAALWRRGELPIDKLITRRIALDEVDDAFAEMQRGESWRAVIEP